MKISVKCDNIVFAKKLIEKNVDILYFGIKDFSCRFNEYINLLDLKEILLIKKDTKISIVLNNLYTEEEILRLEDLLIELSKMDIDEICFHDYAILQILYERNINIKLHYNPETLNNNFGQLSFFKKNNISKITLSRELNLMEIKTILEKKDIEIEIQGHGFTFFMHSKWPMVSNFKKYLIKKEQKLNNLKYLVIQEDKRKMPNIIFEDYSGTHMFSGFTLYTYELLATLYESKLDSILIDNIFRDEEWTLKVFDTYKKGINNLSKNCFNKEDGTLLKDMEKDFPTSESFLGDFRKMPHMEREDYEQ